MQSWSAFYGAMAAASGALLGLLFVAVSVNPTAVLRFEGSPNGRLAEQAFQNYLAVMMVSFLALFSDITPRTFGMVCLIVTASWTLWMLVRVAQALTHRLERSVWLAAARHHLSSFIGFAILIVSALRLWLWRGQDFDWLAAAMLVLLFSATDVSWQVLKQIAAARRTDG